MAAYLHFKYYLFSHALSIFTEITIFMSEVLITGHLKEEKDTVVQYPVFH